MKGREICGLSKPFAQFSVSCLRPPGHDGPHEATVDFSWVAAVEEWTTRATTDEEDHDAAT